MISPDTSATIPRGVVVTNDVHSSVLSQPRLPIRLEQLRAAGFLIADSGDFFEGSEEYELFGGVPETLALTNLFDVFAPGNHGFAHYVALARQRCAGANVINSNLHGWPGPRSWLDPSGGYLFAAIIGRQAYLSRESDGENLTFIEPFEALRPLIAEAEERNAYLVILSHQGFDRDVRLAAQLEVMPGRVSIFSGHCHSDSYVYPGRVSVVKGPELGRGYAVLYANGQVSSIEITPEREKRGSAHPVLAEFTARYEGIRRSRAALRLAVAPEVASDRDSLTLWLARALLRYSDGGGVLLNRGCVREGLPNSPWLSETELIRAIPFVNRLELVLLATEPSEASRRLHAEHGESNIHIGPVDHRVVCTTQYVAIRLDQSGLVKSRSPLATSLREVAKQWLVDGSFLDDSDGD